MIATYAVRKAFNKNHFNMEQTLVIKIVDVLSNIAPIVDNRIWLAINMGLKKYEYDSKFKKCNPNEFFFEIIQIWSSKNKKINRTLPKFIEILKELNFLQATGEIWVN